MRIALLSDIHGNLPALEAVRADMSARGVDVVINAGDLLSGPLWPAETADLLMTLGWPTITGNHERQLLACARRAGGASDQFAWQATTARHHAWLRCLPATLAPAPDVHVCHGAPGNDLEYLLETLGPGGSRPATVDEVRLRLRTPEARAARLLLCGHSHLPRVLAVDGTLCVNGGSVGLPAYEDDHGVFHVHETGSPHARYALCSQDQPGGDWSARVIAVEYDWAAAAARAQANQAPDWARWLATGRA